MTLPSNEHSIFDADCPNCDAVLEPIAPARPADGPMWRCHTCGFTAERAAGMLIETRRTSLS